MEARINEIVQKNDEWAYLSQHLDFSSADGYVEPHPPHSENVIGALLRSESEGKDRLDAPSRVDELVVIGPHVRDPPMTGPHVKDPLVTSPPIKTPSSGLQRMCECS